jgi:hypothetical protein
VITETHVIFDHKFVTTPSVAAPCGGGGGEGCSSCGNGGDAAMPGQVTVAHDSMHVSIRLGNSFTGKRAAALNIDVPDLLAADAYLAATAAGTLGAGIRGEFRRQCRVDQSELHGALALRRSRCRMDS